MEIERLIKNICENGMLEERLFFNDDLSVLLSVYSRTDFEIDMDQLELVSAAGLSSYSSFIEKVKANMDL